LSKRDELDRIYFITNAIETMTKIQPTMSPKGMLTFLTMAALEIEEGSVTVKQISERLDTNSSAAGKLVKSHTLATRIGTPGSQLLLTMEDPANRKSTRIKMTVKGSKALRDIIHP
jgi:DNA-binding MarR family transcriptional regulator